MVHLRFQDSKVSLLVQRSSEVFADDVVIFTFQADRDSSKFREGNGSLNISTQFYVEVGTSE